MGRPGVGNPGNKGGGRKSAYQEMAAAMELRDLWENPERLQEAMLAIKQGKPALKHIFIATAAQDGGERLLDTIAKRIFPEEKKPENNQPVIVNIINYGGEHTPSIRSYTEPVQLPAQDSLESGTV